MSNTSRLAAVIPISRAREVDGGAPFKPSSDSGLVNARFAIDDGPAFWGYHDPDRRWNGWAEPAFCREVAVLIVEWINTGEEDPVAWWDGDVIVHSGGDGSYADRIRPDALGLYRFDGWAWLESSPGRSPRSR